MRESSILPNIAVGILTTKARPAAEGVGINMVAVHATGIATIAQKELSWGICAPTGGALSHNNSRLTPTKRPVAISFMIKPNMHPIITGRDTMS